MSECTTKIYSSKFREPDAGVMLEFQRDAFDKDLSRGKSRFTRRLSQNSEQAAISYQGAQSEHGSHKETCDNRPSQCPRPQVLLHELEPLLLPLPPSHQPLDLQLPCGGPPFYEQPVALRLLALRGSGPFADAASVHHARGPHGPAACPREGRQSSRTQPPTDDRPGRQ